MSRKMKHAVSHELPEKTSKLSVEIFRLLREGDANSRNKAQELLKSAMAKPLPQSLAKNPDVHIPAGVASGRGLAPRRGC